MSMKVLTARFAGLPGFPQTILPEDAAYPAAAAPALQRSLPGKPPSSYIPGLDGMRAVAILAVLVCHGFEQFGGLEQIPEWQRVFYWLAGRLGTGGVKLFFAISGYLICSRFAEEISRFPKTSAVRAFYVRRFFRIIPPLVPYLLTLSVAAWLALLPVTAKELWAASLFSANYFNPKSWYTAHFWSLAVEEHFYLLWAPLLAFSGPKFSKVTAILVIAATSVVRPLAIAGLSGIAYSRALEQTHLQLDSFMFPCLVALMLRDPKWRERFTSMAGLGLLGVLAIVLVVSSFYSDRHSLPGLDPRILQSFCFTLLVILPTLNSQLTITRALETSWLVWIGRRSYGIYIWQQLFFVPISAPFAGKVLWFLIRTAIVLAISYLSYRFLETPLIRRGRTIAAGQDSRNGDAIETSRG